MLEAVLSKCIMHYLKEYLKPLQPGQMELKLLHGSVKLHNLQLLPTALIVSHVPFLIRKGSIKFVNIVFPWNNLKNAACEVLIEDIFIVLQFESEVLLRNDFQADQKSLHIKNESNSPSRDEQIKIFQGLFESTIDNLRVQIKNVHLRIEFPCDPKPIIIGIYTPDISIQSVDENGNIITEIQHPNFVRKQFLIKDFSIYFDTNQDLIEIKDDKEFANPNDSIQAFTESMISIMKQDHQYIFKPTQFKSVLIHTKDKSQKITNQIQTIIEEISLSLDLPQCRSIIHLNYIWNQFMKRRKYTSCMRPRTFSKSDQVWQYVHRCAIVKNKPHVFKPFLALTILKARTKYVDLFKQAKVSKLSANLLGSPKQKLVSLEKKVGRTASIYLREYAEAIYVKEQSMKTQSDVTAYDISELKTIFENTEFVFSMHQFYASFEIRSMSLELLYEKDWPLVSMNFSMIDGDISSLKDAVTMNIGAKDAEIVSHINEISRTIFKRIHKPNEIIDEKSKLVQLSTHIPTTGDVSQFDCNIEPIKVTLDIETIENILGFFTIPNQKSLLSFNDGKLARFEIGELLQILKRLSNYKMSVNMSQMVYAFPFRDENKEIKFLEFEMCNFSFNKNLDKILAKTAPKIPMDLFASLNLKAKIDNYSLLSTEDIKAKVHLVFTNGKLGVDFDTNVDLATLQVFLKNESLNAIKYAVGSILSNPIMKNTAIPKARMPILIVGRSKINFDVQLKALNLFLDDNKCENQMRIIIGDMNSSCKFYISSFQYSFLLKNLKITQFEDVFVEIREQVDIKMDKEDDTQPLNANINVLKPHLVLNYDSINWISNYAKQFNFEQKSEQVDQSSQQIKLEEGLTEPHISRDPTRTFQSFDQIKSSNEINQDKSIEAIEASENRIRLTKKFTPSSMIFAHSILTQSIDDFLERSNVYDDLAPLVRSIENLRSESSDLSSDEEEEEEDDSDIIIPKETIKDDTVNLNLNVDGVWIEMHDTVPNGTNPFFKIDSISMLDYSKAGFKLAFKNFTVGRGTRLTFQPTDFIVPIYQQEPIDIFMDFANAEIFSGDIVSMSTDSAKLFKLMFGGDKPIFNNEVNINIYAKNGRGTFVKENREIITTANVGNVAVCISFKSKELNVDVKVDTCNGFYNEDNYQFVNMKGPFHCHYKGIMNGQDILVEVPSSKMTLKHSVLEWGTAFANLPPDDRPLQPLKIKVKLEPSIINFLAKETESNSNKISLLQSSSSNIFTDVSDDYCRVISIILGKTDCSAFRDGELDLDLDINGIHIKSDIFDHSIFGISHFRVVKKKGVIKSKIPSVEINIPISILAQLANEASKFIPNNLIKSSSSPLVPTTPKATETYLPNFGVDIEMTNLSVSFYPSPKRALRLEMPGVKFILNSSYKISAFEIGSIKVFTVYHSNKPILVVDLSKIQSILTFDEKTEYSVDKTTVETIRELPQKETTKQPLTCLYFDYKMESMQINYTHFFAKMLIGSIFKSMIDCQSLPVAPEISMESFSKLGVKFNFSIDKIQINFVIIDPFASVTFTGIKLSYNEKWEASVNNITVLPITKDESETSVPRSLIKKKNDNEDLVSITIQDELYAVLAECDLYIDLKLLFSLTQFMMASPFLKIKPLLAEIKKSEDPNATVQKMDYVTFSKTLPFALIFNLKKADISVPITLEKDNTNELQIHISCLIDANSSSLSINMSSLSINFYDITTKTAFPSILSNFTTHFSVEIQNDFSLSFKANILDINLMFSAGDIYLFVLLGRSISKALSSQIFAFEEQNFDIFQLRISYIELISSKMTFVLCKDTRSSSQGIPIFRCVIPPMMFKVKKTTSHQITESPVQIDVQPYVEYYNVLTGNFDLIIEPIDMHLYAIIIDEQMKFGANILSNLNINFPMSAILKMKDLVSEITSSLENNNAISYSDLPSMWLSNKLSSTVCFFVNKEKFALEHDMFIPLYGYSLSSRISFSIDEKHFEIAPNEFNYPTYISRSILVVKKPFKGGMMISFERTYQVENNLSFPIEMYYSPNRNKEFNKAIKINPHERQPLIFDEEIYVAFIKKGQAGKCKHDTLKLYLLDKSLSIFPILLANNKEIPCIKTVYNDTEIAARIVSISSQYVLMNLLPSTLYFKDDDDDEIYSVKRGETIDIHFIENDTFTAYLSLDENKFLDKKSHAKIDYKNTNLINFYNPDVSAKQKCMVEFAFEKEISQTTIILYIPVVVYNMSLFSIGLEVYNKKSSKVYEKDRNYSNSFELPSHSHHYWCPHSLIDHSDDDSLMVTVCETKNPNEKSKQFDCLTTGRETILLPSISNKDLFVPLRCNISNQSRTSILTFSPLITLTNNLDFDFTLTPIRNIPEEIEEKSLMPLIEGKVTICDKFGRPMHFLSHSNETIPLIPFNGTFAISIEGFNTSPSLCLLEPQKTVFKVQNKEDYILIELQVTEVETGIIATFNKAIFPTPILINNQLDCTILAFQLVYLTPFVIEPHSTSIFAFDEPFVYPSVTLSFGKNNVYRISLVEDTEKIEMKRKYNDTPVYVQVKHNKYGNRLVIINQEVDEQPEKYNFIFESCIYGIAASLIDFQIRETALIYLSNLTSRFTFNTEYLAVSVTLKSIQVDDQNPLAPNPTVIYGHYTDKIPYLSFNCLCPISTSQFTSFDYFAINTHRIDVDCDSSFISDWMNFFTSFDIKTIHKIKPKKPSKSNQNSLIALRYFEVTPTVALLCYNRKSSRPPMIGKVPRFLKFVPSIKSKKMILPGIVISRLTDRITAIETKLIDDYKTAAFNAILGMLGSAGKILKILGIASAMASSLGIKMTSDMTSEVALNSYVKNTSSTEFLSLQNSIENDGESNFNLYRLSEYDNRFDDDELGSCFSYDALSSLMKTIVENQMEPSPLIQFTTPKFSKINKEMLSLLSSKKNNGFIKNKLSELQKEKNNTIQEAGLRIKSLPGIGYGRGIAGVLTKELNDTLENSDAYRSPMRIREPRPYAGQRISNFNPAIAQAQKIIFKNGGLTEKAREISVSKDGNKKIVIIMTENAIYVFSEEMSNIIQSVKFSDVSKVNIDNDNIVSLKLKNGKNVVIIIDSKISINFMLSILRMHNRFDESLLL